MRVNSRHHRLHRGLLVVLKLLLLLLQLRCRLMLLQRLLLSLGLDVGHFGWQAFLAELLILNVLCQSTLHTPLVDLAHLLMQTDSIPSICCIQLLCWLFSLAWS